MIREEAAMAGPRAAVGAVPWPGELAPREHLFIVYLLFPQFNLIESLRGCSEAEPQLQLLKQFSEGF